MYRQKKSAHALLSGFSTMTLTTLLLFTIGISQSCKKKDVTPEPIPVPVPVPPFYMEPITDIDGNVYHTVKIGNQIWTVENLKTTHYRNGDAIPKVDDFNTWPDLTTGAYCEYGNNATNVESYGRLYNWHVTNDSRKIAPDGWRVPTQQDWQTLVSYLGDADEAGGKLKETGTSHWVSPNTGATDEWGFRALPSGKRRTYYEDMGDYFYCWTSQEVSATQAPRVQIYKGASSVIFPNGQKHEGYAIRLIKE